MIFDFFLRGEEIILDFDFDLDLDLSLESYLWRFSRVISMFCSAFKGFLKLYYGAMHFFFFGDFGGSFTSILKSES